MNAATVADLPSRLSFDCPASLIARLRARYDEPHRRYHTWSHIVACLDARDALTDTTTPEIDLALLFHDAVYEPFATDNEIRSGELLLEEGRRAWIDDLILQRAQRLVRATAHASAEACDSEQARIVVDADLSILGADGACFEEYERLVRDEYSLVDDAAFTTGRIAILRGFLDRPAIYSTLRARRLWEARARRNLEDSLVRLDRRLPPPATEAC